MTNAGLIRALKNNATWLSLTNNEIGMSIAKLAMAALHKKVRKVSCHAGFLASLTHTDFRLLMETIAQLQHLQDLWLALPSHLSQFSSDILRLILNAPHCQLQKLTVRGIDDAGCQVLARALSRPIHSSCMMTELQIRGTSSSSKNNNHNETDVGPLTKVTRRGILAIAKMLEVNESLERLDLCYNSLDNSCLQAMAKAVSVNQKLLKLGLTVPTGTSNCPSTSSNKNCQESSLAEGYNVLIQTMRTTNYTLQNLNTTAQGDQKQLLDLFVKLNRTGARAILRSYTVELDVAMEVMYNNTQDVSALYELLSLNPALWDPNKEMANGASLPPKSAKAEPISKAVMARWNESIFSSREREKIKNLVRWTPIIIMEEANNEENDNEPTNDKARKETTTKPWDEYYSFPCVSMNVPSDQQKPRRPSRVLSVAPCIIEEAKKKSASVQSLHSHTVSLGEYYNLPCVSMNVPTDQQKSRIMRPLSVLCASLNDQKARSRRPALTNAPDRVRQRRKTQQQDNVEFLLAGQKRSQDSRGNVKENSRASAFAGIPEIPEITWQRTRAPTIKQAGALVHHQESTRPRLASPYKGASTNEYDTDGQKQERVPGDNTDPTQISSEESVEGTSDASLDASALEASRPSILVGADVSANGDVDAERSTKTWSGIKTVAGKIWRGTKLFFRGFCLGELSEQGVHHACHGEEKLLGVIISSLPCHGQCQGAKLTQGKIDYAIANHVRHSKLVWRKRQSS